MLPSLPIKIAIADDHAVYTQGIETVLKFSPDLKLIIKAHNGANLLELIERNHPDVVLLDLRMPVMDGFATLPMLKKLYPEIKVIILSLDLDGNAMNTIMKMGANGYLLKSADPAIITKTIRQCYNQDMFVMPEA